MPELFALLDRVQQRLRAIRRETVAQAGLTPPQYFLLGLLWDGDGRPLKELAAAAGTTRATITGIVDTLERKGLARRAPNPADRRSTLLVLTPAGRALRKRTPAVEQRFAGCCTGLDEQERRALGALLEKLGRSLDPAAAGLVQLEE